MTIVPAALMPPPPLPHFPHAHTLQGAFDGLPLVLVRRLAQALDHVGRGIVLLTDGAQVLHANRLAQLALGEQHPLCIEDGRMRGRDTRADRALADALDGAMRRGLRCLLTLGEGANTVTVAVLPIDVEGGGAALLSLSHSGRVQDLAVQFYARQLGFTAAETGVLEALIAGQKPGEIARNKGVRLSTVRTQIGQLRLKAGADSIRQLLERVLALPPMMALVQ